MAKHESINYSMLEKNKEASKSFLNELLERAQEERKKELQACN